MYSIAIISDLHDWHSKEIEYHLKKKNCEVIKLSFNEIELNFSKNKKIFFNKNLHHIDGAWVRFINSGSLEEITTKLTFIHLLKDSKVYTHNSAETIEKTVDKVRTTGILKINGIDSPDTIVWINKKDKKIKFNSLLKPIFGSQGKGIQLLKKGELPSKVSSVGNVYYLQKFLGSIDDKKFCDLRVLVSNHKVIACMKRTSRHYLTNIYQGAEFQKGKLSKNLTYLSEKISKCLGLGYGGIDFKSLNQKNYILEVNGVPSWKTINKLYKKDLSKTLVDDFIVKVKKFKQCRHS